jgi:DHA3 family macrolide efflux protein-like MFS transporter
VAVAPRARLVGHPYRELMALPAVRRFMAGFFATSIGDGIALVSVPWAALELAPPGRGALAVALATFASFVSGLPIPLLVARRPLSSRTILLVDCAWRGGLFALIGVLEIAHALDLALLVSLLAAASLTRTLAIGARRLLLASLVPAERRLAASSAYGIAFMLGTTVVGGAVAGAVVPHGGLGAAFLLDAGSFLVFAASLGGGGSWAAGAAPRRGSERVGAAVVRLLAVAGFVSLLDGVVEVAVPVFVRFDVGGGAGLYGAVFTGFGVGSLAGTLVLGSLRRRVPLGPVTLLTALGWGAATVAFGLTREEAGLLAAALVVGVCWGPFGAAMLAAIQEASAPGALPRAMNAWATVQTGAMPVGLAIGGPLVAATGPRAAIVGAGAAAAAVSAVSLAAVRRPRRRRTHMVPPR